jgi:hypothetical protein
VILSCPASFRSVTGHLGPNLGSNLGTPASVPPLAPVRDERQAAPIKTPSTAPVATA